MANPLPAFWRSLSTADQPKAAYLARALLADLPVTFAVSFAITKFAGIPLPTFPLESLPRVLLATGVFAPIVETFGMAVVIAVLQRITARTGYVVCATALIAAGLHSLARPYWGLEILWAFVVFALCYTTWQKKSPLQAFWMTVILHSLHNLVPTLLLLATRQF